MPKKFNLKEPLQEILSAFHEGIRNRFHLRFYLQVILSIATISIHLIIVIKEDIHINKLIFSLKGCKTELSYTPLTCLV